MFEQAYLTACYILGSRYHSGQASKGYRLLCQASERARREHPGWRIDTSWEQLYALYPKGGEFRNAVAFWLKSMRHSRWSL